MIDSDVSRLSRPGTFSGPLTEVSRGGARPLLVQAVDREVASVSRRPRRSTATPLGQPQQG